MGREGCDEQVGVEARAKVGVGLRAEPNRAEVGKVGAARAGHRSSGW